MNEKKMISGKREKSPEQEIQSRRKFFALLITQLYIDIHKLYLPQPTAHTILYQYRKAIKTSKQ